MTELIRLMKDNAPQQDPLQVNFAHGDEFAGTSALTTPSKNAFGSWIIDTGATNHMCAHPSLLTHHSFPIHKSLVNLPDGSSHSVDSIGTLHSSDRLLLQDVLCIPAFKYILLSVQKLCSSAAILVLFSPSHCWLQDLKTRDILVVGRVIGGLDVQFHQTIFTSTPTTTPTYLPAPIPDTDVCPSPESPQIQSLPTTSSYFSPTPCPAIAPPLRRYQRQVDAVLEQRSFKEAVQSPHWRAAMDDEIAALERNSTWDLIALPTSKKAIGSRWVYKQLSQFIQQPREPHWDATIHLVHYLKGTSSLGLFFGVDSPLTLSAFSDSDSTSCLDTRRSVTGYCIFLGGSLVSWKTKKQATVSRSSAETEYRSMASTVCKLLWISYILGDFGINVSSPIPFHCDNKVAIHITENPVFHERTKHLDIDCHIVRDRF
ncbi:UNVERIFIED_CONTAM: Retrovirus-related Pol polyprotein from transposon RE2 [Sesamum radiatum]|uniref:Retrovirus-related Pol polyprotein from transposon RE2 n=1 Tax=Sesamum radiatum TaxID=300843 RepID=A0AAW2TLE7_SESRA